MAAETIEVLATEGFKTSPGELGEQIVVRGIDVDRLKPGDGCGWVKTRSSKWTKPATAAIASKAFRACQNQKRAAGLGR